MSTNLHASTVAMAAYNWLAAYHPHFPATTLEILEGLRRVWLRSVDDAELIEALELARGRGIFERLEGGLWDIPDRMGRVVLKRERDDGADPTDPDYGWKGWQVGPRPDPKTVPLSTLITRS